MQSVKELAIDFMMKRTIKIFILFSLITAGGLLGQDDAPVMMSSSVDKNRIHLGDLIHYSIQVVHDDSVQVEMPGFAANLGQFEIRDYSLAEPRKSEGKIITEASYTITTFFTGDFEIPPVAIKYIMGTDSALVLMTEPIHIVVESLLASEAGDIRDVKDPVEIPKDWWQRLRWPILGLLAMLLVAAVVFIIRRYRAGKSILPVREVPPRPAHEVALEALERLIAADLISRGETKQFYIEISEITRQYKHDRYFVVALEMTTTEVLSGLKAQDLGEEIEDHFGTFLNRCDLVKFAKFIPSENQHQDIVKLAYQIIHETKADIQPDFRPDFRPDIQPGNQTEEGQIPGEAELAEPVKQENHEVTS
jgi:hypothetical protein